MNLLVAISIGPVQEFIAAARKCRDLWYGSHLLSELSKAAALALRRSGAELIFPAPTSEEDLTNSDFTVANKLLASVESSNPEALIDDVKKSVEGRLDIASRLDSMKLRGTTIDENLYYRQLRGTIEFNAAWTLLGEDYGAGRRRVEELLAARKTLRDFPYYEGKGGRQKSSLDGGRESVITGERPKRLFESNLKENEYLDALGVIKRFAKPTSRFDSTVDVAALPFVRGCRDHGSDKRKAAFGQYQGFLRQNNLQRDTYSLLYEHESRQIFDEDEVAAKELKDIRAVLGKPDPPYYAMLLGDGDRMGQTIAGLESDRAHRDFSRALSGFANDARKKIDDVYGGCSIYCGGDDVMALLPLDTALEAASAVNLLFQECLRPYGVTFSAGIVIAHGLEPLNEVRTWAAEAAHTAKNAGGKDAVCITAYARSGAPVSVCGKWTEMMGLSTGETGLLMSIVQLYATDRKALPQSLGYELRDMVERLKGWPEMDALLQQMVRATVKKKECSEKAQKLIERFAKDRASIKQLYGSMLVARWFARAKREATGDAADDSD